MAVPTDFAGLGLWLKADAISGNDGDAIGTWPDSSGNSRDATQATAGKKPILKKGANGLNGLNVLRFDGTDDEMASTDFEGTSQTVLIVSKVDTDAGAGNPTRTIVSKIGQSLHRGVVSGLTPTWVVTGTSAAATLSSTDLKTGLFTFMTFRYDESAATEAIWRRAGVQVQQSATPGGPLVANTQVWRVASENNQRFHKGDIAEIIVYTVALADADIVALETYLKDRYFPNQNVSPSGVASSEAFGSPTIKQTIHPTGISTAEAFGTPQINVVVSVTGVASTEAFGTATITTGALITPAGIPSAESFGTPTIQPGGVTVSATGIPSEEAFGVPEVIAAGTVVSPPGIASAEALGVPAITQTVHATGVASTEAFGTATIGYGGVIVTVAGIPSAEAFGAIIAELQTKAKGTASSGVEVITTVSSTLDTITGVSSVPYGRAASSLA